MATYTYLGDNCADGVIIGKATTNKVAFYGGIPAVQQTVHTTAVTTAAVTTTTGAYGFADTTQLTDLCTVVDEIRDGLIAINLFGAA